MNSISGTIEGNFPILWKFNSEFFTIRSLKQKQKIPLYLLLGLKSLSDTHFKLFYIDPISFRKLSITSFFQDKSLIQQFVNNLNTQLYPPNHRNIAVYINPVSGWRKSKSIWKKTLQKFLECTPYEYIIFESTYPNFLTDLAENTDLSCFTDIILVSGDGSIQELITALYKSKPKDLERLNFAAIPAGSRNALSVEISGKNVEMACLNAIKGSPVKVDVIKATLDTEVVLGTCACVWGFISLVTDEAQHWRKFGPFRYTLVGTKRFFESWTRFTGKVEYLDEKGDWKLIENEFLYVGVGNHKVENIENTEIFFPQGNITDNQLSLVIPFHRGKLETAKYLIQILQKGSHISDQRSVFLKTKSCKISPQNCQVFNIDGESYYSSQVTLEIIPQFLNILTPPFFSKEGRLQWPEMRSADQKAQTSSESFVKIQELMNSSPQGYNERPFWQDAGQRGYGDNFEQKPNEARLPEPHYPMMTFLPPPPGFENPAPVEAPKEPPPVKPKVQAQPVEEEWVTVKPKSRGRKKAPVVEESNDSVVPVEEVEQSGSQQKVFSTLAEYESSIDIPKRKRNLKKELKEIGKLEARKKAGEVLGEIEINKINKRERIENELRLLQREIK